MGMNKYEKPEAEVMNIQLADVITASDGTNSGLTITPSGGSSSSTWDGVESFGPMY